MRDIQGALSTHRWHQHFKGLSISCINSRHLQISNKVEAFCFPEPKWFGCVSCTHVPLALGPPSCQGTSGSVTAGALQDLQGWLRNKTQFGLWDVLKPCKKLQNITGSIKCYSNYPSDRTAAQVTRPRENPRISLKVWLNSCKTGKIWLKESHQSHQQLYHPLPLNTSFQLQKAELTFKLMKNCTLKRKTTFHTNNNLMEA